MGLLVSLYALFFWLVFLQKFTPPIDGSGYSSGSERFILPVIMVTASILTSWASIKAKPRLLFICSLFSFFPIGYYFMGGNSLFSMSIGIAYLGLIAISVGLFLTIRRVT